MHFVLQTPSLQHLTQVKTMAQLWNQRDIFTQIAEAFNGLPAYKVNKFNQKWKEIEVKVESKVWALPLPQTIKKELLDLIKPIGVEIIHWCRYHHLDGFNLFQFLDILLPRQFYWSMHGTIDYAKTAKLKVQDERLSVEKRFEIACLNCLEDAAAELIELMPNHRIHEDRIIEAVGRPGYSWNDEHRLLIAYFAGTFSGDVDLLIRLLQARDLRGGSVDKLLFRVVLSNGTPATCEYFFHKVSQAEKEQIYLHLPRRFPQSPTCGLMYLLSFLNESRRFQRSVISLLTQLLRWPMQPLFMEAAKRAWPLMDSDDCEEVLCEVIIKIGNGVRDDHYAQWFRELWGLSSAEHKQSYLNDIGHLEDLISTKRKEFIQLVFNKAPADQLKELVEIKCIYDRISLVLTDENVISEAALMECKEKAALKSSKEPEDEEKRLRSECVSLFVNNAMEIGIKSREKKLQ